MQRIVFGILAVFFVQVGFQVYTAIQKTNYGYARLALPGIPIEGVMPEIAMTDDSASELLSETKFTPVAVRVKPSMRLARPEARALAAARKPDRLDPAAVSADFRPVVIMIPARPAETRMAEKSAFVRTSETPRHAKGKRSFPQKALAVVKKPYDWLKSAASKLL